MMYNYKDLAVHSSRIFEFLTWSWSLDLGHFFAMEISLFRRIHLSAVRSSQWTSSQPTSITILEVDDKFYEEGISGFKQKG